MEGDEYLLGTSSYRSLEQSQYRLIFDCFLRSKELQSIIHVLERIITPVNNNQNPFIPIRFFPNNKITKQDRLLLAFDVLVLSSLSGKEPLFGKIIFGDQCRVRKVKTADLLDIAETVVEKIARSLKKRMIYLSSQV